MRGDAQTMAGARARWLLLGALVACSTRAPSPAAPTLPAGLVPRHGEPPPAPAPRCATSVHKPFEPADRLAAILASFRAENPGDWRLEGQDSVYGAIARGHRNDYPTTGNDSARIDTTIRAFLTKNRRYFAFPREDVDSATIARGPDGVWRATNHLPVPGTEGYTEPPFTRIVNVTFRVERGFVLEWLSMSTVGPERLDICAHPPDPPDLHEIIGHELFTYTNHYAPEPEAHSVGRVEPRDLDVAPIPYLDRRLGPTGETYTVGWRIRVRGGRFEFFVDTKGTIF